MIAELGRLFASQKTPDINSDGIAAKLVYKFLMYILIAMGVAVSHMYGSRPIISCWSSTTGIQMNAAEICLGQGTYLYNHPLSGNEALKRKVIPGEKQLGQTGIYPGVRGSPVGKDTKPIFHRKYAYVHMLLFLFAVSCYGGRLVWRQLQSDLLFDIIGDIKRKNSSRPPAIRDENTPDKDVEEASRILFETRRQHHSFAFSYVASLLVNNGILALQIFIILMATGPTYIYDSLDIINYLDQPYNLWPYELGSAFPIVTKCNISSYGNSGSEVVADNLCFLHHNHFNMVIVTLYLYLCIFVLVISLYSTVKHFIKIFYRGSRASQLRSNLYIKKTDGLYNYVATLNGGTSFVIVLLAKNIPPRSVKAILNDFKQLGGTNNV